VRGVGHGIFAFLRKSESLFGSAFFFAVVSFAIGASSPNEMPFSGKQERKGKNSLTGGS
jgi:hypothetical protein